jgi:hypothetical protein
LKNFLLFIGFIVLAIQSDDFPDRSQSGKVYVLINTGKLNVREKPVSGNVITGLAPGESVESIGGSEDSEWYKVKLNDGKTGYISKEFTGVFSAQEIQKGKLIGLISNYSNGNTDAGNFNSNLQILGGEINGKWYGSHGQDTEFSYFMNYLVEKKMKLNVLEGTKNISVSFDPKKIGKFGCQEKKGILGNVSNLSKIKKQDERIFYFGTFGISASKIDFGISTKVSDEISKIVEKESISIFQKNNVSKDDLKKDFKKEIATFSDKNGKKYVVSRYAINQEFREKHYVAIVSEINKNNSISIIFQKYESLPEERGNYGGEFHFETIFDLDEDGIPEILFHHIGFDSGMNEFYRIKNNRLESIFSGGGDAC